MAHLDEIQGLAGIMQPYQQLFTKDWMNYPGIYSGLYRYPFMDQHDPRAASSNCLQRLRWNYGMKMLRWANRGAKELLFWMKPCRKQNSICI